MAGIIKTTIARSTAATIVKTNAIYPQSSFQDREYAQAASHPMGIKSRRFTQPQNICNFFCDIRKILLRRNICTKLCKGELMLDFRDVHCYRELQRVRREAKRGHVICGCQGNLISPMPITSKRNL